MPRYLIERHFGATDPEALGPVGSESKRVAAEEFPQITWEHSHALNTADGLVTMCVYEAPDEQYVRDHATKAGLPCDRVTEILDTVGPADFS